MSLAGKIQTGISHFIRFSLIVAIVLAILDAQWLLAFLSGVIFFLTFIPAMIERKLNIFLPLEFEVLIIIFVYATLFLGEIHEFYLKYWWWDTVLHGGSAILLGFIGFMIVYTLNHEPRVNLNMSPRFVFLFSFAFAMMIGAVWEIFEFGVDQIFAYNMQKTGLVDTMGDLIVDAIGALIASFAGYFYIKKGAVPFFSNAINAFVEDNPKLFRKF